MYFLYRVRNHPVSCLIAAPSWGKVPLCSSLCKQLPYSAPTVLEETHFKLPVDNNGVMGISDTLPLQRIINLGKNVQSNYFKH